MKLHENEFSHKIANALSWDHARNDNGRLIFSDARKWERCLLISSLSVFRCIRSHRLIVIHRLCEVASENCWIRCETEKVVSHLLFISLKNRRMADLAWSLTQMKCTPSRTPPPLVVFSVGMLWGAKPP